MERQYADSHGQSEVAVAFCRLLGFELLPRLKVLATQRLYRPLAGQGDAYRVSKSRHSMSTTYGHIPLMLVLAFASVRLHLPSAQTCRAVRRCLSLVALGLDCFARRASIGRRHWHPL